MTGLTDPGGTLTDRYDYEPYGAKDASTGTSAPNADVPGGQFGFAGGYRSVAGLYHYGQRYYDPAIERWTQTDPLDQTGDLVDGNPYLYAGGDPTNLVDRNGEHPVVGLVIAGRAALQAAPRLAGRQAARSAAGGVRRKGRDMATKLGDKVADAERKGKEWVRKAGEKIAQAPTRSRRRAIS